MPARKSDASRKGDVSAARFVVAEDGGEDSQLVPDEASQPVRESGPPSEPPPPPIASGGEAVDADHQPAAAEERPGSADASHHAGSEKKDRDGKDALTIEDLNLPRSIITRLAKGVLPPNTQIQANAILALTKSATVFINHLASSANEFTMSANKKTIMPNDVFQALDEIDYGFMRDRVEAEFAKFNQVQTSKRSTYRKRVAAAKKATAGGGDTTMDLDTSMMSGVTGAAGDESMLDASVVEGSRGPDGGANDVDDENGGSRATKKLKTDGAAGVEGDPSDAETVPDDDAQDEEDEDDPVEEEDVDEGVEDEANGVEHDEDRDGMEHSRLGLEDEDEALDSEDDDRD